MDWVVIIRNDQTESETYGGQLITAGQSYTVQDTEELKRFRNSDLLKEHIYAGSKVSIGDGNEWKSTADLQYRWLMGDTAIDEENHLEVKQIISLDSMHYEPRALDFVTAKYNSLYNRKHNGGGIYDGTDYGDASLRFYDSSDNELSYQQTGYETETEAEFQTRLSHTTTGATKTILDFTPAYKYGIRSGVVMLREQVTYDAYLWCLLAPHIPEAMGGEAPFLAGGYNLSFFPERSYIRMDGGTVFIMENDTIYYSHRIGLILKHTPGDQIGFQMIYELYRG